MTNRRSKGRRESGPKLNLPKLVKDWEKIAERLPPYPEGTAGNLTLCNSNYERGEIARFYDPNVGRLMYGKYPKRITFPNLVEEREDGFRFTWMSAEQSEVSGMDAHAKAAYGDVLIAGLGLGVLPWLASKNRNVRTITVIEIRPEVIELIAPVIENQKINIVQGDVWGHINESPGAYDFIDLDIWPDVGTAVLSIEETRLACAKALKPDGIVRTWMDEMAFRLLNGGGLERICIAMVRDQGSRFVNPTLQTKYPCEFCGTRDYLDCYHLCMECCHILTLPYQMGEVVAERFTRLVEDIQQGQVVESEFSSLPLEE